MEFVINYAISIYSQIILISPSLFMLANSSLNSICRLRLSVWVNQCSLHWNYTIWLSYGLIQQLLHLTEFQQLSGRQQRILSWFSLILRRLRTLDHGFIAPSNSSSLYHHHIFRPNNFLYRNSSFSIKTNPFSAIISLEHHDLIDHCNGYYILIFLDLFLSF
jgi:hypothetical protein